MSWMSRRSYGGVMVEGHTSMAARLLDAAADIAESEGFSALSVRRLAGEVESSRQVVYTHFGGMDGLLNRLHMRSSDLLAAELEALDEPVGTDENMLAAGHAYVRAARRRPAQFELTFGRPVPHFVASTEATQYGERFFRKHIVGLVDAWLTQAMTSTPGGPNQTGHTAGDAIRLARVFWSTMHGLVTIERAGHATPAETDDLVELSIRLLLEGQRAIGATD